MTEVKVGISLSFKQVWVIYKAKKKVSEKWEFIVSF